MEPALYFLNDSEELRLLLVAQLHPLELGQPRRKRHIHFLWALVQHLGRKAWDGLRHSGHIASSGFAMLVP